MGTLHKIFSCFLRYLTIKFKVLFNKNDFIQPLACFRQIILYKNTSHTFIKFLNIIQYDNLPFGLDHKHPHLV